MPANDRGGREVNDDHKIALEDPVVLRDQVVPWPSGLTSSPAFARAGSLPHPARNQPGATSGPQWTRYQQTTLANSGQSSSQAIAAVRPVPQVMPQPRFSLARRKSGAQIPSPPLPMFTGRRPGGSLLPGRRRSSACVRAACGQQLVGLGRCPEGSGGLMQPLEASRVEEWREKRLRFMYRLYDATGGSKLAMVDKYELGDELGLSSGVSRPEVGGGSRGWIQAAAAWSS
jgi:hypothetical protein